MLYKPNRLGYSLLMNKTNAPKNTTSTPFIFSNYSPVSEHDRRIYLLRIKLQRAQEARNKLTQQLTQRGAQ